MLQVVILVVLLVLACLVGFMAVGFPSWWWKYRITTWKEVRTIVIGSDVVG